jgi:hypothetical protein
LAGLLAAPEAARCSAARREAAKLPGLSAPDNLSA